MSEKSKIIGPISAYAIAVGKGYKGTESQFAEQVAQCEAAADKCEELTGSLPSDFTEVLDEIADMETALQRRARVSDSDAEGPDLDITDGGGNVLARFEGGKFRTKDFVSNLDARNWRGKKWCMIGDSLTEDNIRTDIHYWDYIVSATGIQTYNLGHSGAGYYYRGYSYGFRDQAGRVPLDSDVVTIFGSGNDCWNDSAPLGEVTDTGEDTVCGCINKTLEILRDRVPLVNLGIVTPTPWYVQSGNRNWCPINPGNAMEQYCEAIIEICKRNSIPCLDLYHMSNLRPYDSAFRELAYLKDEGNGVHINEVGHLLIAARFQAFLDSLLLH